MLKIKPSYRSNPIEEVRDLSDLENSPKRSVACQETDGPIAVGTTWQAVQKAFGQRLVAFWSH
jgi:hypothetical protein